MNTQSLIRAIDANKSKRYAHNYNFPLMTQVLRMEQVSPRLEAKRENYGNGNIRSFLIGVAVTPFLIACLWALLALGKLAGL